MPSIFSFVYIFLCREAAAASAMDMVAITISMPGIGKPDEGVAVGDGVGEAIVSGVGAGVGVGIIKAGTA